MAPQLVPLGPGSASRADSTGRTSKTAGAGGRTIINNRASLRFSMPKAAINRS